MAAGARTGGAMAIQYEDFQPKSEWKEDDRANILLIYLPAGFQKEQMKVSYIHSTRIMRVAAERPLAHNKWSRFNQAFPVPQNCKANKIQASFQNGVLTITMPKATVTAAPKEAKATQEAPIPPPEAPQQIPQKVSPAGEAAEAKKAGKEDTATYGSASQKQTNNGKKMEGIVSPRQEKPAPDTIDRQAKGKSAGEEMGKPTQQVTEEALSEQLETSKKRKESMMISGSDDQETSEKRKESMDMIPAGDDKYGPIKPLMEKEKGKTEEQRMVKKLKEELKNVAAAAKKTVKGLAMELRSEERQTMVNMGVAVLVIAALGAYFYYRYRSSGTGATAEE